MQRCVGLANLLTTLCQRPNRDFAAHDALAQVDSEVFHHKISHIQFTNPPLVLQVTAQKFLLDSVMHS